MHSGEVLHLKQQTQLWLASEPDLCLPAPGWDELILSELDLVLASIQCCSIEQIYLWYFPMLSHSFYLMISQAICPSYLWKLLHGLIYFHAGFGFRLQTKDEPCLTNSLHCSQYRYCSDLQIAFSFVFVGQKIHRL